MGIASPRIIIVDDKPEHGEAIARKLWWLGYAALFVEYGERLINGEYGKYSGVRLIFMDLDLAGEGRIGDGARAYADVEAALTTILDENNGPWTLVTWTGHADHADRLLNHLEERLPVSIKPFGNVVMNKEDFLNDDGTVKDDEMQSKLREIMDHSDAVKCLLSWEAGVMTSANNVISELSQTAASLGAPSVQAGLGALLYELSMAEAGKSLHDYDDYSISLYKVLTSLLSDRLSSHTPSTEQQCHKDNLKSVTGTGDLTEWKRRINTMINLEVFPDENDIATKPGILTSLIDVPELAQLSDLDTIQKKGKFIRRYFLCFQKAVAKADARSISEICTLYLFDSTPPCDHAQKKDTWHRYTLVCRVPMDNIAHAWAVDYSNDENITGKLKGDFMRMSPEFVDSSGSFVLLINANLQMTLPQENLEQLGLPKYRVREEMLADLMGWLGRHVTRLGHTYLTTP